MAAETGVRSFPVSAGILLGLGIGGFFDGIVLHQLLRWHHMVSGWRPVSDLPALEFNTLWDGLFHLTTYVFVIAGLLILWRAARRRQLAWSHGMFFGTLLMGFGLFNLVEGLVDHQLLGVHHVNELAPPEQWIYWDIGFLIWGAAMLVWGWALMRRGRREMEITARILGERV
ncbi:DUF2243 domain-containing protein [Amaricoccus solimangrovi]|uniref:DUF2243 domain-containing protein n=1 Tax=Amaricoccus solimangrovi TaxID=2589815 RepID=A0A501WG11_9RHOB|nr:DUF2243 domain-containing protein [Amaricoccus solimangrovi]TPE48499.1 DUF2243 domain-containing protein [Amaricoccus solimangrovi]